MFVLTVTDHISHRKTLKEILDSHFMRLQIRPTTRWHGDDKSCGDISVRGIALVHISSDLI